jgi:RNA polymerase sigma factor (sigma-70 family)
MSDEPTERPAGIFPATRWSAIEGARSDDPVTRRRALDQIVAAYWRPVYKYIRARWRKSAPDAQDLTQEIFATLIEGGTLAGYQPARARLRTYLRSCVDALVANADRDARRQKRGGDTAPLSLEFELAEGELARTGLPAEDGVEAFFEREWVRSLFALAIERMRRDFARRGKELHFRLFERYDLDDGEPGRATYAGLASEFAIAITDVTNHLAFARREFRRFTLDVLREMTATDDEYRREARALLGPGHDLR